MMETLTMKSCPLFLLASPPFTHDRTNNDSIRAIQDITGGLRNNAYSLLLPKCKETLSKKEEELRYKIL